MKLVQILLEISYSIYGLLEYSNSEIVSAIIATSLKLMGISKTRFEKLTKIFVSSKTCESDFLDGLRKLNSDQSEGGIQLEKEYPMLRRLPKRGRGIYFASKA